MRNTSTFENTHVVAALTFVSATLSGWTVQDWAAFAALVYSLMLIGAKALSWYRAARAPVVPVLPPAPPAPPKPATPPSAEP